MKGVAGGNICACSRSVLCVCLCVCARVSSLSWMKQKPFCFQCCRTLIFPGSTARSFCGRTGNDDPPWPPPPLAQASLFISTCAGRASRGPIQSIAAAALMIWLYFRLTCGRVYNWNVCGVNGFCLTNAELGDICPSACRWCRSKTWNEENNSACCWCPSVMLINRVCLLPLHWKAKEKLYEMTFLSFIFSRNGVGFYNKRRFCTVCSNDVQPGSWNLIYWPFININYYKKSSEGFHLTLQCVPFLLMKSLPLMTHSFSWWWPGNEVSACEIFCNSGLFFTCCYLP